ncbi:NADHubiquinone oxidoreductase subunit B2 [Cricetulus griseus]
MSALTRLAPLGRVGGRLLRGCRARAAGGLGVRHLTRRLNADSAETTCVGWEPESPSCLHGRPGHFSYPDPSQWTDEELGIPPDEED